MPLNGWLAAAPGDVGDIAVAMKCEAFGLLSRAEGIRLPLFPTVREYGYMARQNWNRDETLAAFNLYCRTPFGRLHARNPDIVRLADALGRTPGAVAMKCCNLASLDPSQQARGISGLKKASRLDEEIWNEFNQDAEAIGYQSEVAFAGLTQTKPRDRRRRMGRHPGVGQTCRHEGSGQSTPLPVDHLDRLPILVRRLPFADSESPGRGAHCSVVSRQVATDESS